MKSELECLLKKIRTVVKDSKPSLFIIFVSLFAAFQGSAKAFQVAEQTTSQKEEMEDNMYMFALFTTYNKCTQKL